MIIKISEHLEEGKLMGVTEVKKSAKMADYAQEHALQARPLLPSPLLRLPPFPSPCPAASSLLASPQAPSRPWIIPAIPSRAHIANCPLLPAPPSLHAQSQRAPAKWLLSAPSPAISPYFPFSPYPSLARMPFLPPNPRFSSASQRGTSPCAPAGGVAPWGSPAAGRRFQGRSL